jgi:RsiW-degrading membrane proteinase PrsW (M82 family)
MLFFFISGSILSFPFTLLAEQTSVIVFTGLGALTSTVITVAFLGPFIEEFSKAFPLFYRHGETEKSILNLALMVGLGFGIFEFILYVASGVSPIFRLPGLFFHPASVSITAFGIATKKIWHYYLIAVAFHIANNFIAPISSFPFFVSVVITAIAVIFSLQLRARTKERIIEGQ